MYLKTNDINFSGRYVIQGKCEEVNKAIKTIRLNKGGLVEFLPISGINCKYVVVATDNDSITLKSKRSEENFLQNVKRMTKEGKSFLSSLFKYIFGTDSDALILKGDNLTRFTYNLPYNNYDNGTTKYKKTQELFVDGTCKKYSSTGRLYFIRKPDGSEISIPSLKEQKSYQSESIQTLNKTEPSNISKTISAQISPDENFTPYKNGIMRLIDENGKTRAFSFPDGTRKNFDKDENLTEIIFPDGRKELFNEKGRMYLTIMPDGTKEYNRRQIAGIFA